MLSCSDILTNDTDGISNTMKVTLNDSVYTLTNVVGGGSSEVIKAPVCKGMLNGKSISIWFKIDDTVSVGTIEHKIDGDVSYTIDYDSSKTIVGSGYISAVVVSPSRAKGEFNFTALYKNDTLRFRNGSFNVYLKTSK